MFNFSVFDKNIQNLIREGEKKHFRKKTLSLFFGKVNEGDEIKKTLDIFLEKFPLPMSHLCENYLPLPNSHLCEIHMCTYIKFNRDILLHAWLIIANQNGQ